MNEVFGRVFWGGIYAIQTERGFFRKKTIVRCVKFDAKCCYLLKKERNITDN